MNNPEQSEKPRRTKKANKFVVTSVSILLTSGSISSFLLGNNPLISKNDIMIVTKGLAKRSHILGSLANYFMRLTNIAPVY